MKMFACMLVVVGLSLPVWAAEEEAAPPPVDYKQTERYKNFQVREFTPLDQTPVVTPQVLDILGDLSAFGLPWGDPAPELWFPVGEISQYEVAWGVFTVGDAVARADWVEVQGRRLLTLTMEAESNGIVEMLYPVKTFMQTLIDPVTFLPICFEKQSREGKRKSHELTTFDHANKTGRYQSFMRGNEKHFAISADTRDLMGLMYWIRKEPIRKGEEKAFEVMTDEKLYELLVKAEKKTEKIAVDNYGKISCVKMEPEGKFDGMFVRKGRMFLWVSDDERYTICRAAASVPVASIKILLTRIHGPGDDFWVATSRKARKNH